MNYDFFLLLCSYSASEHRLSTSNPKSAAMCVSWVDQTSTEQSDTYNADEEGTAGVTE